MSWTRRGFPLIGIVLADGLGVTKTGGMALVKIWELPRGNLIRILEVHHGV